MRGRDTGVLCHAMTTVLAAQHLAKRFGTRLAVDDVSFSVGKGEVFGFLGPNGAGKTTTIRMLVGLIRPTSGRVEISGIDMQHNREAALRKLGCIVESPDFYDYMSGRENLAHFARMVDRNANRRIDEVATALAMRERLSDSVSTYSLGMRQRLGLAQALIGNPELLILDEPANGLDPAGIHELRGLLRRLADEMGISIFVSSHLLGEIEKICDRVAIVHRGRTLTEGCVADLVGQSGDSLEKLFLTITSGETVGL